MPRMFKWRHIQLMRQNRSLYRMQTDRSRHPALFRNPISMSSSRPVFRSRWLPYVLVAPQLIITIIFFIWPAGEALWYSVQSVDPFGLSSQFVGLDNFTALFHDSYYLDSFWTTMEIQRAGHRQRSGRFAVLCRAGGLRGARQPPVSDPDAAALRRRARRCGRAVDLPV